MPTISVQRHRNASSDIPDAMNVFGVTSRYVPGAHYSFATALQLGMPWRGTVIKPVVIDFLLLAFKANHHGPSFVIVRGRAAVRQPRNQKNGQIVVGLFVQQVDTEALLDVALTIFGTKPSGRLREFLGNRCDEVGDPAWIGLLRGDRSQIVHILVKAVWGWHWIAPRTRGVAVALRRSRRVKRRDRESIADWQGSAQGSLRRGFSTS